MFPRIGLRGRTPLNTAAYVVATVSLASVSLFGSPAQAQQAYCQATEQRATVAVKPGAFGNNDLDLVGFNHQDPEQPWLDDRVISALQALDPGVVRYPGGTVSTYWDHRNDNVFIRKTPGADGWVDEDLVRSFVASLLSDPAPGNALDYFAVAHRQGNFSPLFVINMATPGPDFYEESWGRPVEYSPGSPDLEDDWWLMLDDRIERALDMLRRADGLGLPVEHIELGNEYYFVQDYQRFLVQPVAPDDDQTAGEVYSKAANYFAERIKAEFPQARIAAISAETREDDGFVRKEWNVEVLDHLDPDLIDAVSLHVYIETNTTTIDSQQELLRMARSWRSQWRERFRLAELERIDDTDYEVWITELATNFYTPEVTKLWGNTLINSLSIHFLATENNYEMALIQQFREAYESESFEINNLGTVTGLWARAVRDATRRAELRFSVLDRDLRPQRSLLFLGDVFQAENGDNRYLMMNFADEDISLDVSRLRHEQIQCEAYFAEDLNSLESLSMSAPVSSDRILIPKHSIVILDAPASQD